jgi:D-alanyl-lipoteichoic acid acyltransferase DltB (MBOAT superfamily)
MALGVARLFNIHLTPNFHSPYLATSIADFWRRWHISFSRWLLDYLFTPLQMLWRNLGVSGTALALLVTFLASGLWHGSQSGFIVWGLLHGIYLATGIWYRPYKQKLHKALGVRGTSLLWVWQVVVTFNLVCGAWIFFRAGTLTAGMQVVRNIFSPSSTFDTSFYGRGPVEAAICATLLLSMALVRIMSGNESVQRAFFANTGFRWSCYLTLVISSLALYTNVENSFIYLRF